MGLVVALTWLLLLWLSAAPARAAVAPGRVAFSVGLPEPRSSAVVEEATAAVALPDGGAVLVAPELGRGLVAARLRADGSLERSFGSRGVVHVRVPMPAANPTGDRWPFSPLQLLRQADGNLLAVGPGPPRAKYELGQMLVVRLSPEGAIDPTFGSRGLARPGVQVSCGGRCRPASLAAGFHLMSRGSTAGASAFGLCRSRVGVSGAGGTCT